MTPPGLRNDPELERALRNRTAHGAADFLTVSRKCIWGGHLLHTCLYKVSRGRNSTVAHESRAQSCEVFAGKWHTQQAVAAKGVGAENRRCRECWAASC